MLFSCLLVLGGSSAWASPPVSAQCSVAALPHDELAPTQEAIHSFRARLIERVALPSTIVNGTKYKLIGRLGRSASVVNLAQTHEGKLVAIKTYSSNLRVTTDDMTLSYYELVATDFLRSQNVDVPKILDIEITGTKVVVVKEYVEGLTGEEILWNVFKLPPDQRRHLLSRLEEARAELESVFTRKTEGEDLPLRQWLVRNEKHVVSKWPALTAISPATLEAVRVSELWQRLTTEGDFESNGNLLWNTDENRWILFDP